MGGIVREYGIDVLVQLAQLLSAVRLLATPGIAARQASLSITNSRSSLKPMSILYVCVSIPALKIGSSVPFF